MSGSYVPTSNMNMVANSKLLKSNNQELILDISNFYSLFYSDIFLQNYVDIWGIKNELKCPSH